MLNGMDIEEILKLSGEAQEKPVEGDGAAEVPCAGNAQEQQLSVSEHLARFAEHIEKEFDSDFVVYSGNIGEPASRNFHEKITKYKKKDNVILWLSTYGGFPDSAYRMGKSLQNNYKHIVVLADDFCKSSGTLLALCADHIWMTERGEFGPLDIQLLNKDEFLERNSGLDSLQALSTLAERSGELLRTQFMDMRMGARLSTKQALDAAARVTIGLLSPIYAQLEPMRLGEVSRSMKIAYEYGKRLDKGNLKPNALENLIAQYPSHSYVLDKCEAEDRLFNNINEPPEVFDYLIRMLKPYTSSRLASDEPLLLHLREFSQETNSGDNGLNSTTEEAPGALLPKDSEEQADPDGVD